MKKYKLYANAGERRSFDVNFEDVELLAFTHNGREFFLVDKETRTVSAVEAGSYTEALVKLLRSWYPRTYEEWKPDSFGDYEPCGIYRNVEEYYTVVEETTSWEIEWIC